MGEFKKMLKDCSKTEGRGITQCQGQLPANLSPPVTSLNEVEQALHTHKVEAIHGPPRARPKKPKSSRRYNAQPPSLNQDPLENIIQILVTRMGNKQANAPAAL